PFQEWEALRKEMDRLSREIDKITNQGVEMEANFGKFGYSAHIRTHDALHGTVEDVEGSVEERADVVVDEKHNIVGDGTGSGFATPPSLKSGAAQPKDGHPHHKANEKNFRSTTMKLWKRPVLRQYFHQGLLWRAQVPEEICSFELFVDLLYVGIIAVNGDKATEHPNGQALLRFCITFIPSWKIWTDITTITSQFETDDIQQRICVLFVLACLVGYTTNIMGAFDATYSQLIAFYLATRLFAAAVTTWMGYLIPQVRPALLYEVSVILLSSALWIGSIFVDEPRRQALIWIAIIWDVFGSAFLIFVRYYAKSIHPRLHDVMMKYFDYFPAINIEHKTERTGAFVTLVFGYSVVGLLYQNRASFGINAFFGKAVLGLIQAFCFNWMYFDIDASHHHLHAIRRHMFSAMIWLAAHLPFTMSFTLAGAALSRLVVAHDTENTSVESLTEVFQERSEEHLADALRWFYCGGLSVSLVFMTIISSTHIHSPLATQRLRKGTRLAFRLAIAAILMCLSLATHLDSLELVGTCTSLTVLTLAVDIWGTSCKKESFWGGEAKYTSCKTAGPTDSGKSDDPKDDIAICHV
ncbi:hypothetical protein FRB99_001697, partial [Tulasnella sp. 403]